jgi:hypothetical protein
VEQVEALQSKSFKGMMESYQSSKLRNELLSSSYYQESPSSKYSSSSSSSSSTSNGGKGKVHFSADTKVVEDDSIEKTTDYSIPSMYGVSAGPVSQVIIDDALQNMLMAWYHSGYATGRYQTLCELNQVSALPSNSSSSTDHSSHETS